MMPALPPPIADAYESARSRAFPVLSLSTATKHGTPPPLLNSDLTVWPGPLGAIIKTSMSGLALIKSK